MNRAQVAHGYPVGFLGKRGKRVAAAQAGLDMPEWYPLKETGPGRGQHTHRITLGQDEIGTLGREHSPQAVGEPSGSGGKRLLRVQAIKTDIGLNLEEVE